MPLTKLNDGIDGIKTSPHATSKMLPDDGPDQDSKTFNSVKGL